MARGRMISKSLSASECFASVPEHNASAAEFTQLLYCLLVPHADDFGRQQGDVHTIRHVVYPTSTRTAEEFATALTALHAAKLIAWYEVKGKKYIEIVKFDEHQSGLHKRTRSKFPAIPGTSRKEPASPRQLKGTELKRTEEKRTLDQDQSPIHRRAARAGLSANTFDDREREIRRLTALCHVGLIRPYLIRTNNLPPVESLPAALEQEARHLDMPVSAETAQAAVARAIARWDRSARRWDRRLA